MVDVDPVIAAGAVVFRRQRGRTEVLLVHRPRYDDWAFPKGKLDPRETARSAAVREVLEETGAAIRLGPPLPDQTYPMSNSNGRGKLVHYWVARVRGEYDPDSYEINAEIDEVAWYDLDRATERLTYDHDREVLLDALPFERKTYPLIVLRHAEALSRKRWKGDDRERRLTQVGQRQSQRLTAILAPYGLEKVVSSSSRRCWSTVAPYAGEAGLEIEVTDQLAEEDATGKGVAALIERLREQRKPTLLCTHRPVLPLVFRGLEVAEVPLDPAGLVVVHHRKGRPVAFEQIDAPSGR